MAFIEWNEDYSVKIESIDKQHKVLVDMINDFYEGIHKKSKDELLTELIKKLKEYTVLHFTEEEKLLKKNNYTDYENHKKVHDEFVVKIVDLEKRFKEGKMVLTVQVTNFLKDWLFNHILGTDMKYSRFLHENNLL